MKRKLCVLFCAFSALFALPSAAQVPAYVPTDGLVGWWPFNGNANDESGNGNDGVVNGAVLTSDRSGNYNSCFSFDGVNDVITIPHNDALTLMSGDFTISIWYRVAVYSDANRILIIKTDGPGTTNKWAVQKTAIVNGGPSLRFHTNGGLGSYDLNALVQDDYNWHHALVSHEAGIFRIYHDGELIVESSSLQMQGSSSDIRIGGDEIGGGGHWHQGEIDDIAIYNRALTEQEIQNLYTSTTPPPCTPLPSNLQNGLVGYWPFCGNANDESGNGNDGTVNGAVLTEDRFGNANSAYSFDGVDDFIELGDINYINAGVQSEYTISFWVNLNQFNGEETGGQCVLLGDEYAQNNGTLFQMHPTYGFGSVTAGSANWAGYCSCTPPLSIWTHYSVIQNNAGQLLYVNGELWGLLTDVLNSEVNHPVRLGLFTGCSGACSRPLNGLLDDLVIYDHALTAEEVQELYTLDACTFTVYDTVNTYETVYDTLYTNVMIYDTLTTYETIFDTLYTNITIYDTLTTYETIYDTVTTYVTVTDTLLIDITFVGFEGQPSWLNTVVVYPNPASDHITIHYGNYSLMAGYNTVITDAGGATVYSSAVNSQLVDIDINAWGAAGVYYMSIYDANGGLVAVRHIVLQ